MAMSRFQERTSELTASQEGLIFNALALLPEDYYVFHSFRITDTRDGTFRESETDFVIFNRTKGVICLEAKAGQVRYENGCCALWLICDTLTNFV